MAKPVLDLLGALVVAMQTSEAVVVVKALKVWGVVVVVVVVIALKASGVVVVVIVIVIVIKGQGVAVVIYSLESPQDSATVPIPLGRSILTLGLCSNTIP